MKSWDLLPGRQKPTIVAHACNPREREAGGSKVQGQSQESQDQPRVYEVIPQKQKPNNNKEKHEWPP